MDNKSKPLRMSEKFRQIRVSLGLSQKEIAVRLLSADDRIMRISPRSISDYERGKRQPSLIVIYAYSKLASVRSEVLIDDELDLPGTT